MPANGLQETLTRSRCIRVATIILCVIVAIPMIVIALFAGARAGQGR